MDASLIRGAATGVAFAPPKTGFGSLFRALTGRIRRRANIRAGRRHLQALPDHMLRDIGISRSEIVSAAEHGRSGAPRRAHGP